MVEKEREKDLGMVVTGGERTQRKAEDTEKENHSAAGPQRNSDGGCGLAGNSLPWRHENLRPRGRYQGLVVRRRKTTEGAVRQGRNQTGVAALVSAATRSRGDMKIF